MDLVQREISKETVTPYFIEYFGQAPTHVAAAPGRVNLIGEHTDYNNGFVMPMALDNHCVVAVAPSPVGKHRFCGSLGDQIHEIAVEDALVPGEPFWSNYVRGVLANLHRRGIEIGPVDMLIDSNVPRGGGLSSSAALEVAVCTALAAFAGVEIDPKEVALIGQAVEHEFVNVPCGIMDQFISANGKKGMALKLDCATLEYELVPMNNESVSVLVLDSAVKHSLADGAYGQRRKQCEEASSIMGVPSLRDDYEVSCAEVDTLVSLCDRIPSASSIYGARMTGGGFGGCIVALVKTEDVEKVAQELLDGYCQETGIETTYLVTRAGEGARVLYQA